MDAESFRRLISGEQRGLLPAFMRAGLRVLSWGYGLGARSRNLAFNLGWKKTHRVEIPVISLGNLTAGGTGKTPFAAFTARWFRQYDIRVCLISRGYHAASGEVNDEALVLDQLCPDVPHLQNPDRVAAARTAIEELESQLLILDDGFQHRRLARDLDVVLVDALNPWGYGSLLPRGLLREPGSSLRRAGLVVITRANQSTPAALQSLRAQIERLRGEA
ncbi:MAG TPA: tetraacyldisaccharide 4'-kinase, partial [Planctomycetaceae bacterium]|nr:tetraacyldisaccharide 4'-kinase [Planctomycetaceae bacterium]